MEGGLEKQVLRGERYKEDVQLLKSWLLQQPHLPHEIDEEVLISFVFGTKNLEKAKKKVDAFVTWRGKVPSMFGFPARDPLSPAFQKSCEAFKVFFLPNTTEECYRVLFAVPHNDFSTFTHELFDIRWMMYLEIAMTMWPDMKGLVVVNDLSTVDGSVMNKVSIHASMSSFGWLQDSIPIKVKNAIFFNAPASSTFIYSMVKPFLTEKIRSRTVITSEGCTILKRHIPRDILPLEYGGNGQTCDELNDDWLDILIQKRDWFMKTSLQISDETMRPIDNTTINGSFRYLQMD